MNLQLRNPDVRWGRRTRAAPPPRHVSRPAIRFLAVILFAAFAALPATAAEPPQLSVFSKPPPPPVVGAVLRRFQT